MPGLFVGISAAAAALLTVYLGTQNTRFAPNGCERLGTALRENVVGQPLATRLLTEYVCTHLQDRFPAKPLVLSLHGQPGVGKTFSHTIAARALYGHVGGPDTFAMSVMRTLHSAKQVSQKWLPAIKEAGAFAERLVGNPLMCPGDGCPAYKVVYGMDYVNMDRVRQHYNVREAILAHAREYPESLIVIEEYDKLHCDTRQMLRQMLSHSEVANVSLSRSIILLEANQGMFPIQEMLMAAKSRDQVSPFSAHHVLKEHMYTFWKKENCEKPIEAAKFGNLVNLFVPYFPLERGHLKTLILKGLESSKALVEGSSVHWSARFVEYFMEQVKFDGAYATDGAVDAELAWQKVYDLLRTEQRSRNVQNCPNHRLHYYFSIDDDRPAIDTVCLKSAV